MAQSHNFRSAIGGFNREDVVRYIEYINTKNTNTVNQLKSENQSLKEELSTLRQSANAPSDALRAELEAAQETISALEARVAELTAQRAAEDLAGQELEAYRRAERMERNARERANEIYRKAAATLAEAGVQLDSAVQQYNAVADTVAAQINSLHAVTKSSKEALETAAATMYAIRPEDAE